MASVFGHAILAGAVGSALKRELRNPKVIILGMICSVFPDIDVLSFRFGVPYSGFWGHRGMTHSILFGVLFGLTVMFAFHWRKPWREKGWLGLYYSICTVSHGVLDGMTTGGMGIAYLSPFDTERYFLPFRKILVSPLGASRFFSHWGFEVIRSEAFWIGIPSVLFMLFIFMIRKLK